jgi:hypothetical protein
MSRKYQYLEDGSWTSHQGGVSHGARQHKASGGGCWLVVVAVLLTVAFFGSIYLGVI